MLHFPEIRIAFPTLEMPSLFHARHDATKFFNATQSPLVDEPALELDNVGPATSTPNVSTPPTVSAPACTPYCPPACGVPTSSLDTQLKLLNERLARLDALEAQLAEIRKDQAAAIQSLSARPMRPAGEQAVVTRRQPAAPPASRPVAKQPAAKLQNVVYEEEETLREPQLRPIVPQSGLSQPDGLFGDWTKR